MDSLETLRNMVYKPPRKDKGVDEKTSSNEKGLSPMQPLSIETGARRNIFATPTVKLETTQGHASKVPVTTPETDDTSSPTICTTRAAFRPYGASSSSALVGTPSSVSSNSTASSAGKLTALNGTDATVSNATNSSIALVVDAEPDSVFHAAFAANTCASSTSIVAYVPPVKYTVQYHGATFLNVLAPIALAALALANPPSSVTLTIAARRVITFDDLPREIRGKVCTMLAEAFVQVVKITDCTVPLGRWTPGKLSHLSAGRNVNTTGSPSFLQTTRVCRQEGLRHYDVHVGIGRFETPVIFSFIRDVLYITKELGGVFEEVMLRFFNRGDLAKIEYVCFEVTYWPVFPIFLRLIQYLPNLKEVYFTHLTSKAIAHRINAGSMHGTPNVVTLHPRPSCGIMGYKKSDWENWWKMLIRNMHSFQEVVIIDLKCAPGLKFTDLPPRPAPADPFLVT